MPVPSKEKIRGFIDDPVERFDEKVKLGSNRFGKKCNYVILAQTSNLFSHIHIEIFTTLESIDTTIRHDIFFSQPPKFFIKSWKNPCWYERTTQLDAALQRIFTLRCLPAFYIAGFPKCGTTDIWYRILQHPQVANFTKRESHWWSTTKWYMKGNISEYINVYSKAMIDREAEKRPNLIIGKHIHQIVGLGVSTIVKAVSGGFRCYQGDDSPSYMWMQNFRMINTILVRDLLKMEVTPPEVLTPHLIREYSPRAKFIVMLRDPIERLYSHYLDKGFISANLVSRRAMRSLLGFHSQVVQKTALFYDCLKRKPIRTCAHDPFIFRENNEFLVRLERGLYSVYIAEWLKIFPREQFLFLRVEDYAKDVSKTLKEVFSFLEIDQLEDSKHRDIVAAEVANQAKKKGDDVIGPMWNITRDILEEFYRPFNVALAGILGDKRYLWDD
ncbi:carbohydrate sulfotransferase 15-like [Lineus longissimus]|uniref:carbohydrate sulfotransferase 15-like n=1 Tax=Lineus longissimus TaxID=88925 RepID=UPI00315D351D